MLIENVDYFVHIVPFPPGRIDGAVMPNDDGTFSIYIDANADEPHQRTALEHELRHIEQDHFYVDKPIEVMEAEADGKPAAKKAVPTEIGRNDEWSVSWELCMIWAALRQSGTETRTYAEWREAVSFHLQ